MSYNVVISRYMDKVFVDKVGRAMMPTVFRKVVWLKVVWLVAWRGLTGAGGKPPHPNVSARHHHLDATTGFCPDLTRLFIT